MLIFGISGFISLERGVVSLLNPQSHQIDNISISYIILAISFVFEANALRIAFSLFKKTIAERGNRLTFSSLTKEFKESKDTSVLTVLVEDTSALIGITVAAAALFLTQVTGNRIFDSIGSLIIGLILMAFAVFLAKENKELLIGESISRRDYRRITAIVSKIPEVDRIISIRSMYLATDDVLIAIEVSLIDNLDTDKIEFVIDNIENKVREIIPYADPSKIYVEPSRDDSSSNSDIKSRYSKI